MALAECLKLLGGKLPTDEIKEVRSLIQTKIKTEGIGAKEAAKSVIEERLGALDAETKKVIDFAKKHQDKIKGKKPAEILFESIDERLDVLRNKIGTLEAEAAYGDEKSIFELENLQKEYAMLEKRSEEFEPKPKKKVIVDVGKPPIKPPKEPPVAGEGEGGEFNRPEEINIKELYEKQKDLWLQEKDVRVHDSKVRKRLLQKELRKALKEKSFTKNVQKYDKAIQIYIDSKRNPEQISEFYNQLSSERKEIIDMSQSLPENIKAIIDKIQNIYQEIGLEALDSEVIRNVLDNYAGRIWDIKEKIGTETFRKFGATTRHAKARVFDTIIQGWANDFNLKVAGATNNLQIIEEEIVKTIEDKKFLKALQKIKTLNGESLLSTKQFEGYVKIEHPNFKTWKWAGHAEEGKSYGKNFFIDKEGNLFERQELYAPKEQANNMNIVLGISKLKGKPGIDFLTKYNAITKAWILQSSFFHHLAFMRSYYLGTQHKKWDELNLTQAYKQGLRAIEEESPIIRLGVRHGLTLGIRQDWNEELLQEKTGIGKLLDKWNVSKDIKDKILDLRQKQADFLFGELGAGLKAKSFLIEYRNLLKKHPGKTSDELAKMAANLINDDFGGLHLQRLGRDPTIQHIFRLFALAPDWTESNVRTMVKAFKPGDEGAFYRKFWAGIFTKSAIMITMANVLMNGEDTIKNYKSAWKEGKFRWLDVDITNLYKALGGKTQNKKYFSIMGHFKDPAKFIAHPVRSAQHKGSVVYRFFHEALTGVDWAGRRFTTAKEILGMEKKKLKGKTVAWDYSRRGPLEFDQIPSFIISQIKGWQPIQIQNLLGWIAGEIEGFDAIAKSAGLRVSTTHGKKKKSYGF